MTQTINNSASTNYSFPGSPTDLQSVSNTFPINLLVSTGLTLSKTSSPSTFTAGSIITYTITITNNSGQFLSGVRIIDDLGSGNLACVLGSASLSSTTTYPVTPVSTNPLTFTLQQLGAGATMTLTYKCQVIFNLPSSVNTITNSVRGIGYTSTGTVNGYDFNTITRNGSLSNLSITKSSSVSSVIPGQTFSYYLTLRNSTSSTVDISNITDSLPTNFVLTSVYVQVGSGSTTELLATDYTLSPSNLLTINTVSGSAITVPSNGTTIVTLNGYFS